MKKTRTRVFIMGRGYNIVSDDNIDELKKIADEVDKKMRELREENPLLTYDNAAILTALNFSGELLTFKNADGSFKNPRELSEETNRMRSQLVEYSKELSRAESTIRKLEKELERAEIEFREKEDKIKREYAAKEKEIMDMLDSL